MKNLLLATVLFTVVFTSCKKEKDCPIPVPPIDLGGAIFKGNITIMGTSYDNSTIAFKADGSADYTFPGFPVYKGTWSKTPNSSTVNIVITFPSSVWKGAGTITADGTKIENGTLTPPVGGSGTGTFTMTKQ
jgi:hypothetical protein